MKKPKVCITLRFSDEEYEKITKRIKELYKCENIEEFLVKFERGEIKLKKHKNKKLKT